MSVLRVQVSLNIWGLHVGDIIDVSLDEEHPSYADVQLALAEQWFVPLPMVDQPTDERTTIHGSMGGA